MTVSVEAIQVPLEMVQTNVFVPILSPVTLDVGDEVVAMVPAPETTLQLPVPIIGVFPFNDEIDEQMVESLPAFAAVGNASTKMDTVSEEEGQVPLAMVQTNVFTPTLNPVTPQDGEVAVNKDAPPAVTVHVPFPITGVFPFKVEVVEQMVESKPALATVGNGSTK